MAMQGKKWPYKVKMSTQQQQHSPLTFIFDGASGKFSGEKDNLHALPRKLHCWPRTGEQQSPSAEEMERI